MQIRFLTNYKHRGMNFAEGDVTSALPEQEAVALVEHGFAEDVAGNIQTGTVEKTPRVLEPKNVNVIGGVNNG